MHRLLLIFSIFLFSCSDDSNEPEQYKGPQNIQVDIEIKGAHDGNLFGDGSGVVHLWVGAENTNQLKVIYDGTELLKSTAGYYDFIAKDPGIHEYEVEIIANNTTLNLSTSKLIRFEVNKVYQIPESLYKTLILGDKKWKIAREMIEHVAYGPETIYSFTWSVNEEINKYASMYDDIYVFGYQLLTHETNGTIVGKVNPLSNDFGGISEKGNEDDEYENYPLQSYSTSWKYSPGGSKFGYLHLDGKAFIGSYVGGTHIYEILGHGETKLVLRTLSADGNYWYFRLTTE